MSEATWSGGPARPAAWRCVLVVTVWFLAVGVLMGCRGSPVDPPAATPAASVVPAATSPVSTPSGAPSPASTVSPSAGSWSGSGRSLGADRVRWPGSLDGARHVLAGMPSTLGGKARHESYNSGEGEDPPARDAGVVYESLGSVAVYEEYATDDTGSGKSGVMSAGSLLSASFGLMYGCATGTYHGTAPRPMYTGGGPGTSKHPTAKPVWFSCRIDGAEGDDGFSGYAVGWTSKKTAWLVVARDQKTTRLMMAALHEAAG